MRPSPWLIVVIVGAVVGCLFAGISTYDFVQHLDRQVHTIHCSFVPGGGGTLGPSGCQTAMMSPYSSVFRTVVWGGIPISLAAMSVFAFIAFYASDVALANRERDRRATGFLALATALPAVTSIVMAIISVTALHAVCTQCIVIYVSSAMCLLGGIFAWRGAVAAGGAAPRVVAALPARDGEDPAFVTGTAPRPAPTPVLERPAAPTVSYGFLGGAFAVGVLFVAVPVGLYIAMAPDHAKFVGTCDGLAHPEDPNGVMVSIGNPSANAAPAIEILDPLCPACRAFEERLDQSGMASRLDRRAVLFPLDSTCNWMVDDRIHPGACAISEAVLCAGDRADEVVDWAFANQEQIREASEPDPDAAARMAEARFPELADCIGSPAARARLNKSLRWAVANGIQVLTPQLYIDNVKLCDEDVDLGLEYALGVMLDRHDSGTLVATSITEPAAPAKLEPTEEERRALANTATPTTTTKPTEAPPAKAEEPPAEAEPATGNAEPAPEPAAEPAPEPAAEPAPEPAPEPAAEPEAEPVTHPEGGAP